MGFTLIDNEVLESQEITKNELITYIAIIRYYNKEKGYAYPSYKQIKGICKIKDDRTLINAIDGLVNKDFIKKETVKGIGNKYYIPTVKLQVQENYSNSSNTVVPTVKSQEDVLENYSTTNTNTNTKINTKYYIDLKFIDDVIDKVKITQEQYDKLVKKFSKDLVHKNIVNLDNYIANGKGSKYKDHYRVLNTWCNKPNKQQVNKSSVNSTPNNNAGWNGYKKFE